MARETARSNSELTVFAIARSCSSGSCCARKRLANLGCPSFLPSNRDRRQRDALAAVVRQRVGAELVLADTTERASRRSATACRISCSCRRCLADATTLRWPRRCA